MLQSISLTIDRGETCAVLGKSGSGKSTLLHVLAGLLEPSFGRVSINGQPLTGLPDRRRERLRLSQIGLVFQHGELLPELSVFDNVALPLRLLGKWTIRSEERCKGLLDSLDISDQCDRFLGEISGGQLQRAAVARAVVHKPAVILADEPTGSLDGQTAQDALSVLLRTIKQEGAAMVLVTHDMEVASSCDRIFELVNGRLSQR